jgi:hypothetical protein
MTETAAGAGVLAEVGLAGRMTELSRAWVLRIDNLPPPW